MTILVADDHPIYIEGLVNLLRSFDFTVVGSAQNGLEAISLANELKPDIVLMDANMPEMDGIEATKQIRQKNPQIKVVILTGIEDDALLLRALDAGAMGFLLKRLDGESLQKNLLDLQSGKNPFSPGIEDLLRKKVANQNAEEIQKNKPTLFTERDETILRLLSRGRTYKEIGGEIHLSEPAVKYHIKNIKEKCNVKTQAELVELYRKEYN